MINRKLSKEKNKGNRLTKWLITDLRTEALTATKGQDVGKQMITIQSGRALYDDDCQSSILVKKIKHFLRIKDFKFPYKDLSKA